MDAKAALLNTLVDHCLGAGNPTVASVSEGNFERASDTWKDESVWPRELVGCLVFVSQLLRIRYEAWRQTRHGGNESTERQLGQVRGASHVFLIQGVVGREVGGVELSDGDEEERE